MTLAESGVLLIGLGAALSYLSRGFSRIVTYVKSKCMYYITCNNDNAMY